MRMNMQGKRAWKRGYENVTVYIHVYAHVHTVHVHDKQSNANIYTKDSFLFFKEKTALGGFEPTTLRVLGERSTN